MILYNQSDIFSTMKEGEIMASNPFIISFAILVTVIFLLFLFVNINKRGLEKRAAMEQSNQSRNNQSKPNVTRNQQSTVRDDEYHVGGITTEYFILILMKYYSMNYAGYSYEVLFNKKTQQDYDAFALFDGLWSLFSAFDEILALDYVENGFGELYVNGVDVTYDAKMDMMQITVDGMLISGSLNEIRAFRNEPTENFFMLDISTASQLLRDYMGDIDDYKD